MYIYIMIIHINKYTNIDIYTYKTILRMIRRFEGMGGWTSESSQEYSQKYSQEYSKEYPQEYPQEYSQEYPQEYSQEYSQE